jgi:biopolymer transport protein TolQ
MEGHQSSLLFALGHMTVEGKFTLSFLVAMSIASWAVIFSKMLSLWKQRRASRRFHAAFADALDVLGLLGEEKKFADAPSFLAYESICEELGRIRKRCGNARGLLPKTALAPFRALVKRVENEEGTRLESGTVILALAISGGPFVGLTGTVFGVMETFSGVAQAGQANLSAMAPGVAGALVNTIFGLIVAIPALFAYNMLSKSIQALQMSMAGFLGDFAARVESEQFTEESVALPAPPVLPPPRDPERPAPHPMDGALDGERADHVVTFSPRTFRTTVR